MILQSVLVCLVFGTFSFPSALADPHSTRRDAAQARAQEDPDAQLKRARAALDHSEDELKRIQADPNLYGSHHAERLDQIGRTIGEQRVRVQRLEWEAKRRRESPQPQPAPAPAPQPDPSPAPTPDPAPTPSAPVAPQNAEKAKDQAFLVEIAKRYQATTVRMGEISEQKRQIVEVQIPQLDWALTQKENEMEAKRLARNAKPKDRAAVQAYADAFGAWIDAKAVYQQGRVSSYKQVDDLNREYEDLTEERRQLDTTTGAR